MTDNSRSVAAILDELIDVLHEQAKELERLIVHVEGATSPLPTSSNMPIVVSRLSALHQEVKKLKNA